MTRFYFATFVLLSATSIWSLCRTVGAEDTKLPEGFRAIFNGKDLDGWHGHNPHQTSGATEHERIVSVIHQQEAFQAHWRAEQGELINDGHGPYATTDQVFGDLELHVEYRTVPLADSGIYLRGTPQVQIWDYTEAGGKWDRGANRGSGGLFNNRAGQRGKHPLVLADRPFGEWNQFRIIQLGSRTTVFLNDQLVVDKAMMENFWDKERQIPLAARGPIHLQTHGGEIRWRGLHVREFSDEEANARLRGLDAQQGFRPIFNGRNLDGWAGATEDYEVRDGAIVCRPGRGGVLYTEEEYDDFTVRLEFKLPEGGNNGLAIRYPGSGNAAYDGMTELQVIDNSADKYADLDERQYHGSAYGMVPAYRGYLRPVGQWNYQEVTVHGSAVQVELNGTVILDCDLSEVSAFMADTPHPGKTLERGHFGLAGHNDPVMFRRLSIKPQTAD